MNLELRLDVIRKYGSQIRAARRLGVQESRLSMLINGHREPTAEERRRFAAAFGCDHFAPDGEQARAS